MPRIMQREIDRLFDRVLSLADLVQQKVERAVEAITEGDLAVAEEILGSDQEVDDFEVDIEEECLKLLALHQPVAIDLRVVIAVLKINNDLERIGDLAANIAQRGRFLAEHPVKNQPLDFIAMAERVKSMLASSINALINGDAAAARSVCASDKEIDALHAQAYEILGAKVQENPQDIEKFFQLLSVSRYLERIADLATNIAEDVVYLVEGVIVRHQENQYPRRESLN